MKLRASLLVLVFAVVGLAVPAQAEEPELTVTWPTITNFNPDTTTYTFTVDYTGPGTLRAVWQNQATPIGNAGEQSMEFASDGMGTITIEYCLSPSECSWLQRSPELSVYRHLATSMYIDRSKVLPGAPVEARVQVDYPRFLPPSPTTTSWSVSRSGDGAEVAAGDLLDSVLGGGQRPLSIPLPGLPDGDYVLHVDVGMDLPDYGLLSGESVASFDVDSAGPRLTLHTSSPSLYPVHDRYQDSVSISYHTNEVASGVIEVVDARGVVVRTVDRSHYLEDGAHTSWAGRDDEGDILPNGTYEIRLTANDPVGNTSTKSLPITVSDKERVTRTFVRRVSATRSLVSKAVGKCSTLRSPSLHGWKGSLGLYSQTKCKKPARSSVVTQHGIYVPKGVDRSWWDFRVNVFGGAARTNKKSYLILGYVKQETGFDRRSIAEFGPKVGMHAGDLITDRKLIWDRDSRPYVIWSTGLTQGSRYDIRSFTVRLKYYALQ